jgi:hypothetical protein
MRRGRNMAIRAMGVRMGKSGVGRGAVRRSRILASRSLRVTDASALHCSVDLCGVHSATVKGTFQRSSKWIEEMLSGRGSRGPKWKPASSSPERSSVRNEQGMRRVSDLSLTSVSHVVGRNAARSLAIPFVINPALKTAWGSHSGRRWECFCLVLRGKTAVEKDLLLHMDCCFVGGFHNSSIVSSTLQLSPIVPTISLDIFVNVICIALESLQLFLPLVNCFCYSPGLQAGCPSIVSTTLQWLRGVAWLVRRSSRVGVVFADVAPSNPPFAGSRSTARRTHDAHGQHRAFAMCGGLCPHTMSKNMWA